MHASRLAALEGRLLAVERDLRLLDRATPSNFWAEVERLSTGPINCGDAPRFRYAAPPGHLPSIERDLEEVEVVLSREFEHSAGASPREAVIALLLAERARELGVECRLVRSAQGSLDRALVRERFSVDERLLAEADALAEAWLFSSEKSHTAGQDDQEVSLREELGRLSLEAGLTVVIEERPIATLAAVTERTLLVRTGARVPLSEARRVYSHEVVAHLLPRLRAASEGPPYRVGTREADGDEEGRAILCEERAQTLLWARKRQLGLRHASASLVRAGRSYAEAHGELTARGVGERDATLALCRALRGGGLAREIIYLPGYLRVKRALEHEPALERQLERGRVSIAAARQLSTA